MTDSLMYRREIVPEDVMHVKNILNSTNMFTDAEVSIGIELVLERLLKGVASGYHFLFLDHNDAPLGFSCFGPIACAEDAFDLYWIAVRAESRNKGWGSILLKKTEEILRAQQARRLYVETSSTTRYASTRAFYLRRGYQEAARLEDFYRPGDDKIVFTKLVK